ncbi:caspase family protein [Candidatus Pelagibacter sp.]|uniref:caspase family protein n=1 Tax=Candidatus Pelagibacter sp. TaxID=2024849 RepID=UPI003F85240F
MRLLVNYLFLVFFLGLLLLNKAYSNETSLKSAYKINKKEKVEYVKTNDTAYWQFMQLKLNDLRGDGTVYYLFDVDRYYRVNSNFEVVSKGTYKYKGDAIFELRDNENVFSMKISLSSQIADIKSKFYEYKGYRRYQFVLADTNEQEKISSAIKKHEPTYAKLKTGQSDIKDADLKSALDIDNKKEIRYVPGNEQYFWGYTLLIDDLRGNGPVYYKFQIDEYHRLDKNFNVISRGTYKVEKGIFKLKEDKLNFEWKISVLDKIVDIKSKFYDYKNFKRYHFKELSKKNIKLVQQSILDYSKNPYAGYDDSDENLDRLYKLIMENKKFVKKNKYIKYSKKGVFNGKKIKSMALAVFIDYEKELSKLTKDVYLKEVEPFPWGWDYSSKESDENVKFKAIQVCYKDVKKKKLSLRDGECVVVDFRRITGDYMYPVAWENNLITEKENKILIAKNIEKSKKTKKQLAAKEKEKKELLAKLEKEEKEKKKQLLLAQKKAEEERIEQEMKLLAKKKQEEEKKKELILAQIKANEKKVLKDKARYLEKKMVGAFLELNEIIIDDLRGDGKVYYQFEKDKYTRIERDGKFLSEGKYQISKSGEIELTESQDEFFWKLSVRDGVIDIKSKFYPYDGYKRFALDFIYKNIAKETREDKNKLAKLEKEEKEKLKKEKLASEEEKRVQELLLAQKKAEEERKKEEELLAKKKAEEEKKKQELIAQKKAEEERKKKEEIAKQKAIEEEKKQKILAEEKKKKDELIAKLMAEEEQAQKEFEKKKKELNIDTDSPEIMVAESITVTSQAYKLKGKVKDKSEFFLQIDGQPVKIDNNGEFVFEGFVINTSEAEELTLVAIDRWNNSSEKSVKINVELKEMKVAKGYEKLLPNKIKVNKDKNKIAIIIGVEKYEYLTNLDAAFANRDANAFREYAVRALGVDPSNINLLVDKDANRPKILKALKLWLPKIGGENRDIYLFFAGHGLASDDGKNLYILPQDGDASLLEDTAITRSEIIKLLQKTNPKSVTMFFDTCYSGQTRNEETLVASLRPVRIVADDQEIPNNFTIFTASANDQTSGSIEEAKHGMFSYYLMKGMEGEADQNNDNKISNGELIAYVQENVSKVAFSQNREQDPNMSGDKDKILFSYK